MNWLDAEGNRYWQADAQELLEQDNCGSGVIWSDEFFPESPSNDPAFWKSECGCDCQVCFWDSEHSHCKYMCDMRKA